VFDKSLSPIKGKETKKTLLVFTQWVDKDGFVDDPSAGSPTETLLRLLLPLNDQV
jgi:hypothetical protein